MFATKVARATLSIEVISRRLFFHSTISTALFLHPSCPLLPIARAKQSVRELGDPDLPRQMSQSSSPSTNLQRVPKAAINHMIQNYTNIHLPQYPYILESWLHDILKLILQEKAVDTESVLIHGVLQESQLGHFEHFVVFIILAISSLTLTWRAEPQAVAASHSCVVSALRHLKLMEVPKMRTLQVSLLLAHYAHMNPKVDNWICRTNAVRIVLSSATTLPIILGDLRCVQDLLLENVLKSKHDGNCD